MSGTDRLSEYIDGALDRDEAEAIEARLAEEPELRALLDELRAVKRAAATRPDFEAPPELWAGVRRRIDAERGTYAGTSVGSALRRKLMLTLPQLAAAAGIVLLLGVSLGRMTGTDAAGDAGQPVAGTQTPAAVVPAARNYVLFVEDLEARLEAGRGELEPGTARVIEESLAKIDDAIEQARTALESDPNNVYLNQHLASARSRKLRLLEDATALIASRT